MRFLRAKCTFGDDITIALCAKNKGGGVVLHISKQYGVKIAPMAIKRTFSHFYIAECFFDGHVMKLIHYSL